MADFLQRLREGKLVQWALAYIAAAFALIQVLDIVAQRFGWPESCVRYIIIALAVGFFVTLVLAWYHGERGRQRVTGAELLILALLLTIGGAVIWRLGPNPGEQSASTSQTAAVATTAASTTAASTTAGPTKPVTSNPADGKSVAVLPFQNLSADKDNAYFASGMQDMILTKLSGIGDLKVISRTSTEKYASHPDNLKTIARELGVATILEGSVQKSGNSVLINVQLINASTDAHLWAAAYPRSLDNIFGVEGEVAEKVAESLHSALTHDERTALARKPTDNVEAYQIYLKGLALDAAGQTSPDELAGVFRQAVALDPAFALAWAELVWQEVGAYWFGFNSTPQQLALAKAALDRAEALAPDLPQVEMARAIYLYHGLRDVSSALEVIRDVQRGMPNDARVWFVTAMIERRIGKWDDALAHFARAQDLDPNNLNIRSDANLTLIVQHKYASALLLLDAANTPQPDLPSLLELKLFIEWNLGGLDAADKLLAPTTSQAAPILALHGWQALYRRDFKTASDLFARAISEPADTHSELILAAYLPATIGWQLQQALSEQRAGSPATAETIYLHVQALARAGLADASGNHNTEAGWHSALGMASAGLGQRELAVAEGEAAVALIPESSDAFEGPYWQDYLAKIHAQNGDADRALPLIAHLLRTSGSFITPALLKFDPIWDSIRKDPRFGKLISDAEAAQERRGS